MEQEFTITEILTSKTIKNSEKIRLLYLQHNKNYQEIADLLGLKESTVKWSVSSHGYCKVKQGEHRSKHGDIKSKLKKIYDVDPNVSAVAIARKIGCSTAIISKYSSELGITFKKSRRKKSTEADDLQNYSELLSMGSDVLDTEPASLGLEYDESINPEKLQYTKEETGNSEYIVEKPVSVSPTENDEKKPYEILEWPFVYYKGHIYEVLGPRKLKRSLKKDLHIVSKPKNKKRG